MTPAIPPSQVARWLRVALVTAAGALALASMLGTLLGRPVLAALGIGLVPMSPIVMVLVLLLVGVHLLEEGRPASPALRRLALTLALGVALLSLALAVAYVRGDPRLACWLTLQRPGVKYPSLLMDIALASLALAALARGWAAAPSWRDRQLAAILALIPLVIGPVVVISYLAGAPLLYETRQVPMSLPSALSCLALGLATLLAAGRDTWPLTAFALVPWKGRTTAIRGLAWRVALLFLVLAALVFTVGALTLRGQIRKARSQVHRELSTIADLKTRQISAWWGERCYDADQRWRGELIQTQVRRFLQGSPQAPTEGELRNWMDVIQEGKYHRVILFDGRGQVRLSVPDEVGPSLSDLDPAEIQAALQARKILTMDLHRHPGHPDIHMGLWIPIPAAESGAKAAGVLLLMIDPQAFLYPMVQSWPTPSPSAESLLVRRDGDAVLYLNDLRHQAGTALNLRYALGGRADLPAVRAVLGEEGLLEGHDYRGAAVLAALRKVPGTTWFMVAKVDAAEVYGSLRQSIWLGCLAMLFTVLLIGVGLALILKHREADDLQTQLQLSQRFEALMQGANDIILVMDGEGRILEANAQAIATYGHDLVALHGLSVLDLLAPEAQGQAGDRFQQVLAEGATRFEAIHRRQDGSTFPVEVSASVVPLDGHVRVISFSRDITERRVQERALARMTELYVALSQVNQAIVWSPDRQTLLDKICEVLVVFGHFDMAWIGWNEPQSQRVSVAASYGDAKGYLDRICVELGDGPLAQGPVSMAIQQACPCVVNHFLTAVGTEPWREAAAESGYESVAAFPIQQGGVVVGALAVYASEKDFFGPQEAALLVEAAGDITYALDHLVTEARRCEAEAALQQSERFLAEAQAAGGVGTYTWFIQDDLWKSSPFLNQILGIGPDYARDLKSWAELVAPTFRDQMQAYVAGIISRREPFDLDYPIVRVADGRLRWVHGQGTLQWDDQGRPVALVGTIFDITDRKLAEQSLRKIQKAVEQSPLSIVITDAKGNIEYVNPAFTATTGYTAEEAMGENPRILKSPGTEPEVYRNMWETLARGEVWAGEFQNRKKDGSVFYERATLAPVWDDLGTITNYIAIKEDITRLKQDKAERRSLEAQLHQSQKLESLGSLAGGVAHDMNNVLGAILGLASTLRETVDPFAPAAKNLDTIVTACMRGRGVVKGLLYFAHKDLQEEGPMDLNALVQEMSQLLSYTMLKRVELRMDLQADMGPVLGDAGALSHALMNLCVNAMDAMPKGGLLHIQTLATPEGGVDLRVRDTGEGMAPEVLAKAMEPFFTTKPQGKGTGLGLAMVYGTMLAHDGTFTLSSQPGEGTEAILHFPALRVSRPVVTPAPVLLAPRPPRASLRILLVDDDELIRESVGPMLEMLGHAVTAAPGAPPALRLLEDGLAVDLVILDMNMPGMNGAEALPLILALRPEVHVLMATGYSDQEIAPLLEGRPRVSSLRKPFSMREVQVKIGDLAIVPAIDELS